jgi:L-ribulose-5-phosphate 3-epimerase
MTASLHRRDFLKTSAGLVAGVGLAGGRLPAEEKQPLFKISLAEWSFHRALGIGLRGKKTMDNLDFPRVARKEFDIEGVEYVNQFFKDKAKDGKYLAELKKRADDVGVRNVLIMCDGEGALGDPDPKKRMQAVENHYQWVEAAKFLGCHSIRVNAHSQGSYAEQLERAAEGLARLTEFGASHDMNVIVENHGRLSSNAEWLVAVIKKVNNPRCGTLPDFGNFPPGDYRYKAVKEMMPFAKGVSAKSHGFDDKGNETTTDYRRMMKIVLDAGYHGFVGIEYEGSKLSEPNGVRATKKLLERVREELAGSRKEG